MKFWNIIQGQSRAVVRGECRDDALARAAQFGFKKPDSVVECSSQQNAARGFVIKGWKQKTG